jgi:prophage tail gpP-like protein
MSDVKLTIFGDDFSTEISGWTNVRITRGIERIPTDFDVSMTERFPGVDDIVAKPGMKCTVQIDSDTVVTGYLDRVESGIGPHDHPIRIVGRGYCQDLVDCSAVWQGGQFRNQTVLKIAESVAKPFGIEVLAAGDVGDPFYSISMQPGETAFSLITKLCRERALLCYEDESGRLVLGRANTDATAGGIREGVNVEGAKFTLAMDQRFSDYTVIQQGAAAAQDILGNASLDVYTFKDVQVPRYRPKYLVPEYGDADYTVAKAKAQWEANRRLGRGYLLSARVDSWRDGDEQLWVPNTLCPIDLPTLKVKDVSWLIGEVTYSLGPDGTHTELTLMPPDAFKPEPILTLIVPVDIAAALSAAQGSERRGR